MEQIGDQALRCLKTIAAGNSRVLTPCLPEVLHHLEILGLIVSEPQRRLPLEMSRLLYRLTPAGERVLRQHAPGI
ncbi:hypothetical protein [Sedimenticola sp.]|uniref:hypothetical protein n=1 Tax=Sedimenticola sp. TaxID=1940285 RepID=UPI003D0EB335